MLGGSHPTAFSHSLKSAQFCSRPPLECWRGRGSSRAAKSRRGRRFAMAEPRSRCECAHSDLRGGHAPNRKWIATLRISVRRKAGSILRGSRRLAPGGRPSSAASLGPRQPVRERPVPAIDDISRHRLLDTHSSNVWDNGGDGASSPRSRSRGGRASVPDAGRGQGRRVRFYRTLLQSAAASLDHRLSQPGRVRKQEQLGNL